LAKVSDTDQLIGGNLSIKKKNHASSYKGLKSKPKKLES
jgi:hypothetical protein